MRHRTIDTVLARIPADVPHQARRLVGRDEALRLLLPVLNQSGRVLLTGMGGIGKTAVASSAAVAYMQQHESHTIWLTIGGASAADVLDAIGRVLGNQRHTQLQQQQVIHAMLRDHMMLIVLDDVRHQQTLMDVLWAIPPTTPIIATSRFPIPLDVIVDVPLLEEEDALALMSFSARQRQLSLDPTATQLVQQLGYHPYALEIAGRLLQADQLSPAELVERIQKKLSSAEASSFLDDGVLPSVAALLDVALDSVDSDAKNILTVFGGLFQLIASARLLSMILSKANSIEEPLTALLERGLLSHLVHHHAAYYHYQMHELTRRYAQVLYASQSEISSHKIMAAYSVYIHERSAELLDVEVGNILGVIETQTLSAMNKALIIDIVLRLNSKGHNLQFLDIVSKIVGWLQSSLGSIDDLQKNQGNDDLIHLMGLYIKLGDVLAERHNFEDALPAYDAGLNIASHLENTEWQVRCGGLVGKTKAQLGHEDAERVLQSAMALAETQADGYWVGYIREIQADVARLANDHQYCLQLHLANIQLGERLLNERLLFFALLATGSSHRELKAYAEAVVYHQKALELAQKKKQVSWTSLSLHDLGRDYHYLGEHMRAQQSLDDAHQLYESLGDIAKIIDVKRDRARFGYHP